MTKLTRVKRPAISPVDDDAIERIVDEAVSRFEKLTGRDDEFLARFGKWTRPEHSPKYPTDRWAENGVRWHLQIDGLIDVAPFIRNFPDKADRVVIGEIARFVAEEYEGKFCTDKTINSFRIELLRRLAAVGF